MESKITIRDAVKYLAVTKKKRQPYKSTYTDNGDVIMTDKDGREVGKFAVPQRRLPTMQELQDMEAERAEKIVAVEQDIDRLYPLLREAARRIRSIDETDVGEKLIARSEYISLMRQMKEAYDVYSMSVGPEKRIETIDRLPGNRIYVDKNYMVDSLPYSITMLRQRPFPLEKMFEREGAAVSVDAIEIAAAPALPTTTTEGGEKFIPILPDMWLSPDAPILFEYEGQEFNSVRQAIEGWKARSAGEYDLEVQIMKSASALEARSIGFKNKEIPIEIIKAIVMASIAKNKANMALLGHMAEGTYMYMDTDQILGVGMTGPAEMIRSRNNWMGKNQYGLAVSELVSEAHVRRQQAKTGAIISRRRKANTVRM